MRFNFKTDAGYKIFFTSDTHFFHTNIIKFCNRPFNSVEEMNETLINNWNSVVGKNDIVFHLGDFGFCSSYEMVNLLKRLNGNIYLILGNHDRKTMRKGYENRFSAIEQQLYITIDTQKIYLNHLPFLCYDGTYRKGNETWQLFGHVHSGPLSKDGLDTPRLTNLFPTQYDVGVDNNNFTPIEFNQLKKKIYERLKENSK